MGCVALSHWSNLDLSFPQVLGNCTHWTQCQLYWGFCLSSAFLLPLLGAFGDFFVVNFTPAFDWQHSTCGAAAQQCWAHTEQQQGWSTKLDGDGDRWKPGRADKTWDSQTFASKTMHSEQPLVSCSVEWFNEVEGVIPKGHECWRHWVENNALRCMRSLGAGHPLAWPFCAMVGLPRPTWTGFELTQIRHKPWDGDLWHWRSPGQADAGSECRDCPCPQAASACPTVPTALPCESQQCLPSQSKTCCWLQALVLLCCQDAAGPDSSV